MNKTTFAVVEFMHHNYLIVHNILANRHMMTLDAARETIIFYLCNTMGYFIPK